MTFLFLQESQFIDWLEGLKLIYIYVFDVITEN